MIGSRNGELVLQKVLSWKMLMASRNINVTNLTTGEKIQDVADVLISARGALNDMAWPKIPGFESFKGEVMHSAAWNQRLVFFMLERPSL